VQLQWSALEGVFTATTTTASTAASTTATTTGNGSIGSSSGSGHRHSSSSSRSSHSTSSSGSGSTASAIAAQMPREAALFSRVHAEWSRIMNRLGASPGVLQCCSSSALRSSLPLLQRELEKCQKGLGGYLEVHYVLFHVTAISVDTYTLVACCSASFCRASALLAAVAGLSNRNCVHAPTCNGQLYSSYIVVTASGCCHSLPPLVVNL
jgi:Dynein heavy chain, N-terminal region 2